MKKILILFLVFLCSSIMYSGTGKLEISTVTSQGQLYIRSESGKNVKIGNNYIYVNGVSGNIGIGVASPNYLLDVGGSIHISTGALYFPDGSSLVTAGGGSSSSISNDKDAVITADSDGNASGEIQFFIGGSQKMVILNNGNVGIGSAAPAQLLDVVGNISAVNGIFSGTLSADTLDTGLGAYELYAMNQDVETTDNVTFAGAVISNTLSANTLTDGTISIANGILSSGNSVQANIGNFDEVYVSSITGQPTIYIQSNIDMNSENLIVKEVITSTISAQNSNGLYLVDNSDNGIFIHDGGNIGIGTDNPAFKLDVAGSIHISTGAFYFADGSSMTTAGISSAQTISNNTDISITADADSNSSGEIQFNTNGTEKMVVLNDGNVGIGITAPNYKLEVNGSIRFASGSLYFPDGSSMSTANIGSASSISNNQDIYLTADSDVNNIGEIQFNSNGTEKMVILNNGNVGIGIAVPTQLLDVAGNINAVNGTFSGTLSAASADTGLGAHELYAMDQDVQTTDTVTFADAVIANTLSAGTLTDGTISITNGILSSGNSVQADIGNFNELFVSSITGKPNIYIQSNINMDSKNLTAQIVTVSTISALNSNGLYLVDDADNGIFIQDGGNIGIGTDNPVYRLDVNGAIRLSSGELVFPDNTTMNSANAGSASSLSNIIDISITADSDSNSSGEIQFNTNGTEKMVILNNGHVGIGVQAPTGLFQVGSSTFTVLTNGNVGIGTTSPDSTLKVVGSFAGKVVNTTSVSYTAGDDTVVNFTGTAVSTLNLPAASGCSGRTYFVRNALSGGNDVTIDPNGSENINGGAALVLANNEGIIISCNGTEWYSY
ncbi:beta strand repeat-containing protein [bacterium]